MNKKWMRGFAIAAAVLLVATVGWITAGRWALARYPSDFTITLEYAGTVVQHVDATTGKQISPPARIPLQITRHLSVPRSSFDEVTVNEEIRTRLGPTEKIEFHSYALDRRSMELDDGNTSWAYTNTNKVNREGTYRINLPMGIDADSNASIWNNETGQRYTLDGKGVAYEAAGLDLLRFQGHLDATPLTAAARDHLGLPATATVQQLAPQLAAAGLDLAKVQAGLAAILSPQELVAISPALSAPVPLSYTFAFNGAIGVEPDTGGIVQLSDVQESIAVKPDLSGFTALQPVLARHASQPVVQEITAALSRIAVAPASPVLDVTYAQTPGSVEVATAKASDMKDQLRLVNTAMPWALALTTLLCLLLTAGAWLSTRRTSTGGGNIPKVIDVRDEPQEAAAPSKVKVQR
jgi:hypothetical protein